MNYKRFILILLILVLILAGCSGQEGQPPETTAPRELITSISIIVTEDDMLHFAEDYPDLVRVDFTGSTCYAQLEQYRQEHPQVEVIYTIDLGGVSVSPDVSELSLAPDDYEFGALFEAMQFLHSLNKVTFRQTALMPETIDMLRAQYPHVSFDYSVLFCGTEYRGTITSMDLSQVDPDEVLHNAAQLSQFPGLFELVLTGEDGTSSFDLSHAAELQRAVPDMFLRFTFKLFDQTVSTDTEEITFANKYIGNKDGNAAILEDALTVLKGCSRFVLDNCHFENAYLADLRNLYRGRTKIVWRIFYGEGSILTDRKMIRHVYGLYDSNCSNLYYCEDAEYVDFGHNEFLKNCDFVSGMPHLKAIILSGSMISDLSPLAYCKELEFLELTYCGYITDISPLSYCDSLKRLNIAYTKVSDLTPLAGLEMDALVDARSGVDRDQASQFDLLHPSCLAQHTGDAKDDFPYGYPWRYDETGAPNSYYALLQEEFHYPNTYNTIY